MSFAIFLIRYVLLQHIDEVARQVAPPVPPLTDVSRVDPASSCSYHGPECVNRASVLTVVPPVTMALGVTHTVFVTVSLNHFLGIKLQKNLDITHEFIRNVNNTQIYTHTHTRIHQ